MCVVALKAKRPALAIGEHHMVVEVLDVDVKDFTKRYFAALRVNADTRKCRWLQSAKPTRRESAIGVEQIQRFVGIHGCVVEARDECVLVVAHQ